MASATAGNVKCEHMDGGYRFICGDHAVEIKGDEPDTIDLGIQMLVDQITGGAPTNALLAYAQLVLAEQDHA